MSILSRLFGGGGEQRPRSVQPAPRIGDAVTESAAQAERTRARRRRGVEDTILTSGLGRGGGSPSQVYHSTLGGR